MTPEEIYAAAAAAHDASKAEGSPAFADASAHYQEAMTAVATAFYDTGGVFVAGHDEFCAKLPLVIPEAAPAEAPVEETTPAVTKKGK